MGIESRAERVVIKHRSRATNSLDELTTRNKTVSEVKDNLLDVDSDVYVKKVM
jgi:hypothetical protein